VQTYKKARPRIFSGGIGRTLLRAVVTVVVVVALWSLMLILAKEVD